MKNEIAEQIIAKSISVIEKFIEDKAEFTSDIYFIYENIKELDELNSLLEQEQKEYSEEGTIRIAEILFEASRMPLSRNGLHYTYPDSIFKQKPSLYFYERAAENGSIKAMGEVATLLKNGYGGIKIDVQRSKELRRFAAEHGDLASLVFSEYTNSELKMMAKSGNTMAYFALFISYFKKGRKIFAKKNLKRFLKDCSQQQKSDAICWMKNDQINDFSSAINYVSEKSNDFKIISSRSFLKKLLK